MMRPAGQKRLAVMAMMTLWSVRTAMTQCTQDGPCRCTSDQGTIDLSPIQGSPPFQDLPDSGGAWVFSYSPCTGFSEGPGECQNVAVCQVSSSNDQETYPAGTLDSATFGSDSGSTTITYTQTDSTGTLRTTVVTLVCDESSPDTLDVQGEGQQGVYTMTLTSSHCCPTTNPGPGPGTITTSTSISVGSILCIVFFVTVIVYIAAGIAFQKGVRKATGKEVFPNYTLWASIPGLIKDGTLFTVRGCKGSPTYDKV